MGPPELRGLGALGELLSDVPRPESPALTPIRVPVRPVGAARAVRPAASDVLLAVRDLARVLHVPAGVTALSRHQEPPDEDEEPPEVELVQIPDLAHEVPVHRHLTSDST